MKQYFFANKLQVIETVRRAIQHGISDMHIINCSGDAFGYQIDMDLTCILTEEEEKYVTEFADKLTVPFTESYYNAPYNPEFLGAQPARAGEDY